MDLSSISAADLHIAARDYGFPASEQLFASPLNGLQSPNIAWACAARPTADSTWTVPGFWASSLYGCLEDMFLDDAFESLAQSAVWKPLIAPEHLTDEIMNFLASESAGEFRVMGLVRSWVALDSGAIRGLIGCDRRGLFSAIWELKEHDAEV